MTVNEHFYIANSFKRFTKLAWLGTFAAGCLTLLVWLFNLDFLEHRGYQFVETRPSAALCLILASLSLAISQSGVNFPGKLTLGRGLGALVILLALHPLIANLEGWRVSVDEFLFAHSRADIVFVGPMSLAESLSFICIGLTLLILDGRRSALLTQILVIPVICSSLVAISLYFDGAEDFQIFGTYPTNSLHTCLLLLLLSCGILCCRAEEGLMATLTSDQVGGGVARRLLPVAVTVPFFLGRLSLEGYNLGWYGTQFTVALLATDTSVVFIGVILAQAAILNKADAERKQAESVAEHLRTEYEHILNSVGEGIHRVDSNGIITYENPAAALMLGWPIEDLVGRGSHETIHHSRADGSHFPRGECAIHTTLRDGIHRHVEDEVFWRRDGSCFPVSYTCVPLVGANDEVTGVVVTFNDITLRKRAEEILVQDRDMLEARVQERTAELGRANSRLQALTEAAESAREEADAANQAKSDFLSRMSHELRTPLNSILGFSQILETQAHMTDRDRDRLANILKAGRHLLQLINEVLDIAGIEAGRISLSPEPLSLYRTVAEVLDTVRPLAEARGIRLENRTSAQDDCHILADRQRTRQVLLNLLSNAIKYNSERGEVQVSYQQANAFVRLEVKDTGPGLSDEDLEKLFTPFERLHAAKTEIEGTGIGLVLCKRLMQAMEGQIGVESTLGRGSTFWIELPLSDPAGADGAEMETPLEVPVVENLEGPQRTILYIEDNPANFMVVESFLERRPEITLVPAAQGEIGLELALKHLPDLILLDLHLPDIPGEVVLERLRADPDTNSIPVVVLSADATPAQISKLHAAGVDNYLTKPLNLRQFLRVLDEVLDSKNCSSALEITPCV